MCEVSDSVGCSDNSVEQFQNHIADDEPLCLDWQKEIEVNGCVGEHQAECGEETEHHSGSSYGVYLIQVIRNGYSLVSCVDVCIYTAQKVAVHEVISNLLQQSGTENRYKTIDDEAFGSPNVLQGVAEHPNGKHIEEKMREIAVQESVCYPLPYMVMGSGKEVKAEPLRQIYSTRSQNDGCEVANDVYNQ